MKRLPGLYIHIPFCARKCTYCAFNTTDYFDDLAARYVDAVAREIDYWGGRLAEGGQGHASIDTIYFGGGTPSIVEGRQIAQLLVACRSAFDVAPAAEITIEINPATLARDKLETWLAGGVNRASVGVQSFIDRELVSLSRTHSAQQARRTFAELREAGFGNISLDLIAGFPEQSIEDWRFNLEAALSLDPEHLSLYLLEVKDGTQLHMQIERGMRERPDDDTAAEMYRLICEATLRSGYEHYEISNFARLPKESASCSGGAAQSYRSLHNLKYWTGAPFYGFGCGAHSYDTRNRWANVLRTESYIMSVEQTGQAIAERNELAPEDRAAEALFMGLRLREGIRLDDFRDEYGIDVLKRYSGELPRLCDAGLIWIGEGRIMLTDAGRLLSNEVFVLFI